MQTQQPYISWKGPNDNQHNIVTGQINTSNIPEENQIFYPRQHPIKHYRYESSSKSNIPKGKMVSKMMDIPGGYHVTESPQCCGPSLPGSNINIPTNYCCNDEYIAKQRVKPPQTIVSNKYYMSQQQYIASKCQTYEQKSFNFATEHDGNTMFVGNCLKCAEPGSCRETIYKPNNKQYATQGAVSSSSRIHRLKLNTIKSDKPIMTNQTNLNQSTCDKTCGGIFKLNRAGMIV